MLLDFVHTLSFILGHVHTHMHIDVKPCTHKYARTHAQLLTTVSYEGFDDILRKLVEPENLLTVENEPCTRPTTQPIVYVHIS